MLLDILEKVSVAKAMEVEDLEDDIRHLKADIVRLDFIIKEVEEDATG
jgi:hypothetical protein